YQRRSRKYPENIYTRIVELKKEVPKRSAPMVYRILEEEFRNPVPSVSTIRKYIKTQGLTTIHRERSRGYKRFQREKPNDLWQIDIAGVQTVGHLGELYLIAVIDDCSRFVVAGQYFTDQKGLNVIKVLRNAILGYGRPNQILADNGTQFRNLIGELGTKYTRLLESMDIEPIFAAPNHPETKGKLERWFNTIKTMFLPEARHYIQQHPECSLMEFNQSLLKWIQWYNTKKSHRGLPNKGPPGKIYFQKEKRIFRPLKANINWNRWLHELAERKVSKYNEISYKSQKFKVPSGYVGTRIEVIEYEEKLVLYYKENLLITHPYQVPIQRKRKTRKITHNGNISYSGKYYSIDYKLAGRTVEVQEINNGNDLLVYLDGVLLKTIEL
ncbi:MAG: DDE-type integrase/transposase/recombinase, partial [Candidatus Lokiarchaeota archaeon]